MKEEISLPYFGMFQILSKYKAPNCSSLSLMEREKTTTITVQTPLLQTKDTHQQNHDNNHQNQRQQEINLVVVDGEDDDTQLDKTLQNLEYFLKFLGFNQVSKLSFGLSLISFLFVGVVVPVLILELTHCSGCEDYQVKDFEYDILTSQALLGVLSLICMSYNLRKRGIRRFLFVDRYSGHMSRFMDQYMEKIKGSYRLLLLSILPCFILKFAHETIRVSYMQNQPWWQSILIVSALVMSWTYVSAISLAACILFHLACTLQVIHFNDYGKLLEREPNILVLMEEHIRLRHYLSKISHRFRIYLLLVFLFVTASLTMTLIQITGVNGTVTFLNGGNFAVTSVVQVVETLLCLYAGSKISHRAQAIGAVASKWHAIETCSSFEECSRRSGSTGSVHRSISMGSLTPGPVQRTISMTSLTSNCSDSDLESLDGILIPTYTKLASISSYNKRQSFVMYLQTNPGGITLYGWTVDRSLLTTIFFIELSLVLFVLGQTIVYASNPPP